MSFVRNLISLYVIIANFVVIENLTIIGIIKSKFIGIAIFFLGWIGTRL